MKALQAYIDQENKWNDIFCTHSPFEIKTAAGRKRIAERLDASLSPENLTCDGELPRSTVRARYRTLTQAAKELIALDPSVAQYMYEFSEV